MQICKTRKHCNLNQITFILANSWKDRSCTILVQVEVRGESPSLPPYLDLHHQPHKLMPLWKFDASTKFHIFFFKFTFYRWHVALNTSRKVRKKTTNNLNELLCATIIHQVFILAIKNSAAEPWLYPDVCYSWRTDHAGRILLIKDAWDACCVYQKYKQ